jgi:predicted SAM-dependent methyltransferase
MEALHTQTPFLTTQSDVLHLAPEESIEKNLRKLHGSRYVTGDLEPWTKTMKKVDVTEIPFESASFDLVLCSHVLEHVVDDGKAMKEIFRILRPGGMAIVAVPIFVPKTYEDATVDSREQRGQMFGSETHVRLYGSDIVGRLHGAGFDTEILNEDQVEGKFVDRAVKDAARESEKLLFLCRKPGAPGR